jgi:V8-like Glu-specific endopeptidase
MSRQGTDRSLPRRSAIRWPRLAVAVIVSAGLITAWPAAGHGAVLAARSPATAAHPASPVMTHAVLSGGTPAVGALVDTGHSGALTRHFCSASVVDSPADNLVITAAHCVSGRAPGQFVFVPGYVDGRAPYGTWTVTRVIADERWESSADPDDDVAFLQVARPGSATGVQQVTGGERLGISQPSGQLVTVIGYPDDLNVPVTCQNYADAVTPTQLVFRCGGFPDGTSGSPMLADVNPSTGRGTVVGVIGGYRQGGRTSSVSYSARFSANVTALYQAATADS